MFKLEKIKKAANNVNLNRFRLIFQAAAFGLLVYGGFLGIDLGNKLPTFSCIYNRDARGGVCFLGMVQYSLNHTWQTLLGFTGIMFLVSFITFVLWFLVFNKAWCGYICPFGTIQDWITKLRQWIKIDYSGYTWGVKGGLKVWSASPTGSQFNKNTVEALSGLLERNGLRKGDLLYKVSTGYGRKLFKDADETISEITANARGARAMGENNGCVRTIINIGGQDTKVILLDDEGHVKGFAMNDKCAAGTGRFLEVAARNLEIDIEELGNLHFESKGAPLPLNSTCTVFAESEIITLLAHGHRKGEIVAGIHYSIAKRITRLARKVGIEDMVLFDGGPALNKGMISAMEDELMRKVVVPEIPQITTAYGAALIAKENCQMVT